MTNHGYVHAPQISGRFVIRDVTVVDPASGSTQPGRDVHVDAGRIIAVTATGDGDPTVPAIEGRGRWLAPAYVDAHCHLMNTASGVEASQALHLVAGVWGYRQMSGTPQLLADRAAGRLPAHHGGSQLLMTPGEVLTPLNAATVDQARETVRAQARAGADFIKIAFASPQVCEAVMDEAAALGLTVAGHMPGDLDPRVAAAGGWRCVEHIGPGTTLFAAASCCEHEVRETSGPGRAIPALPAIPGLDRIANALFAVLVVNPSQRTPESEAAALALADTTFDEEQARALADLFAAEDVWQCPTLIRLHTIQMPADHVRDPRLRYLAPGEILRWRRVTRTFTRQPEHTREVLRAHFAAQLRLTRVLADAGVPMMAGSDSNGAGWVIPGLGLHDEFALLAEAGLAPLQILQMATINPARFLGLPDHGRIEAGCAADLVLLGSDPTRDATALSDIQGVIRDGGWWSRDDLDAILDRLAALPTAR